MVNDNIQRMSKHNHNGNPFKLIKPTDTLPEEDKQVLIQKVGLAKLFLNIADLFTIKQAQTNGGLLNGLLGGTRRRKNKSNGKHPKNDGKQ